MHFSCGMVDEAQIADWSLTARLRLPIMLVPQILSESGANKLGIQETASAPRGMFHFSVVRESQPQVEMENSTTQSPFAKSDRVPQHLKLSKPGNAHAVRSSEGTCESYIFHTAQISFHLYLRI